MPTGGPLALGTAYLLPLPVHGELLWRIGPRDLHLPALARARRAPEDDPLFVAALNEQFRTDIGRIDQVIPRGHLLFNKGLLDGGRALCLMDGGGGRVDVREEVWGGGFARLADVDHVPSPLRVAFVAVPRLDIVRRFDTLGGR